jgi:parallel beta-helix repeat protein
LTNNLITRIVLDNFGDILKKKYGISLILISFMIISIIFIQVKSETNNPIVEELISEYVPSTQIFIEKNEDFNNYGFPGNGDPGNPYLIQNLNITAIGSYGISISDVTKYFEIRDCYIYADYPIILNFVLSPETLIFNNTLMTDYITGNGITINQTDDTMIQDNFFMDFINGMYIENCGNLTILDNHFDSCWNHIKAFHFGNSLVEYNTFEGSLYYSIDITNSDVLDIFNNTFFNNEHGIVFSTVDNTDIIDNVFKDNIGYGIRFLSCTDNKVYHNYFIGNGIRFLSQAYDDSHTTGNVWYYNEVGNFWTDLDDRIYYPIDGTDYVFDLWPFYNSDSDDLNDYEEEKIYFTNAYDCDTDDDNIPDDYEVRNGLDPLVDDAMDDEDSDELLNIQEYWYGTSPTDSDSDNDLMEDGYEVEHSLNPLADDRFLDFDGDGLTNYEEFNLGTMPNKVDSDSDGMEDKWEVDNGLNPLINDAWEDPDGDYLNNFGEFIYNCNPHSNDTDGDTHIDSWEIAQGTNPNNSSDYPDESMTTVESSYALIGSIASLIFVIGFYIRRRKK